jgi:hypothetical protein
MKRRGILRPENRCALRRVQRAAWEADDERKSIYRRFLTGSGGKSSKRSLIGQVPRSVKREVAPRVANGNREEALHCGSAAQPYQQCDTVPSYCTLRVTRMAQTGLKA